MEENKTLSLVLPENWHFLRGDMRGWGFKCKLSNSELKQNETVIIQEHPQFENIQI